MKSEQEQNLLDKLFNYTKKDNNSENYYEKKPEEYATINRFHDKVDSMNSDLEKIEKDKNSMIIKQNKIITDNIIIKFFGLDDEKFLACLEKINEWGFVICFKEFILDYYIMIIKDYRLRQYIIMNLNQILITLKERLELSLLKNMKLFNFENNDMNHNIELIRNELQTKESVMLSLKADSFHEMAPADDKTKIKLDRNNKKNIRKEIINTLKYENPELEDLIGY